MFFIQLILEFALWVILDLLLEVVVAPFEALIAWIESWAGGKNEKEPDSPRTRRPFRPTVLTRWERELLYLIRTRGKLETGLDAEFPYFLRNPENGPPLYSRRVLELAARRYRRALNYLERRALVYSYHEGGGKIFYKLTPAGEERAAKLKGKVYGAGLGRITHRH